ncbi:MAG TPA: Plug domain-containing protein, partial [Bryobacteraceae bacterium]|nr:Plug domain-containing protein [Bryobacteraceae bacterium]
MVGALLLSSALAAPAFAQIEEVVVTAQKKSEDVQAVPIAVSAFSGADLEAHQIQGFSDLQFAIPSVTFTHGNFGPSNFTIRGI